MQHTIHLLLLLKVQKLWHHLKCLYKPEVINTRCSLGMVGCIPPVNQHALRLITWSMLVHQIIINLIHPVWKASCWNITSTMTNTQAEHQWQMPHAWNSQPDKTGVSNVNFRKISVRKTIWDLEFSEHFKKWYNCPFLRIFTLKKVTYNFQEPFFSGWNFRKGKFWSL